MNDWSYGCVAKLLARSIHDAAIRATVTAGDRPLPGQSILQSGVVTPISAPPSDLRSDRLRCSSPHDRRTMPSLMPRSARCLRPEALMRGRRRMGDQALGVAEIVGDTHELERILEAECGVLAAVDLEGDERRAAAHLLGDDRRLRMVRPAGIDQPSTSSGAPPAQRRPPPPCRSARARAPPASRGPSASPRR